MLIIWFWSSLSCLCCKQQCSCRSTYSLSEADSDSETDSWIQATWPHCTSFERASLSVWWCTPITSRIRIQNKCPAYLVHPATSYYRITFLHKQHSHILTKLSQLAFSISSPTAWTWNYRHWKIPKFDSSPSRNNLSDLHKCVIKSWVPHNMKNFMVSIKGVSLPILVTAHHFD